MVPNRYLQPHNTYALGSPSPAIACPYCLRHFLSRGGRTRHIQARHQAESRSHEPNPSAPPSPIPDSSSHPPSPIPSNYTPLPPSNSTPPPSNHATPPHSNYTSPPPFNSVIPPADYGLSPFFDYLPPPLHGGIEIAALNLDAEDDLDAAPGMNHPQVPDAPSITRAYHPKLDGKVDFFSGYAPTLRLHVGQICDEGGNNIPLDTPPPPRGSDKGPDDWTPYNNRLQFEVADFLFRQNQMSAGHINFLLGLWAASLATHDDESPFSKARHLYNTIDLTPLGDVTWESFALLYNGRRPVQNIPSWMQAEYDVWFRDPRTLVHNLLSNPDFKSGFDYAPFQERTTVGVHRFQDFMSGNWAWKQAVGLQYSVGGLVLILISLGYYR